MIRLRPYHNGSESAKMMSRWIADCKMMKLKDSKYKWNPLDTIINWGNKTPFSFSWRPQYEDNEYILNKPEAIAESANKLTFFKKIKQFNSHLHAVSIPNFADNKADAARLKFPVYCRKSVEGQAGAGIVIANNKEELVDAPLYVEGIEKAREYRFHVARFITYGDYRDKEPCFLLQQKKRRQGQQIDGRIKNRNNGWVFCHEDITPIEDELHDAIVYDCKWVLDLFGLDFGAFDVLIKNGKHYILEVNTAPGMEEDKTTHIRYLGMIYRMTAHFPYPCVGEGGG